MLEQLYARKGFRVAIILTLFLCVAIVFRNAAAYFMLGGMVLGIALEAYDMFCEGLKLRRSLEVRRHQMEKDIQNQLKDLVAEAAPDMARTLRAAGIQVDSIKVGVVSEEDLVELAEKQAQRDDDTPLH